MNQGSKKILISDYSKANKSMYSDLLTKNGFQVVTTFSHEDTIKNLREDNLDLLIIIDDTTLKHDTLALRPRLALGSPSKTQTQHPHKTLKNNTLKRDTLALRLRLAWPIFRVLPAHNNLQ